MQQDNSIPSEYPGATYDSNVVVGSKKPRKWKGIFSTLAILIAAPLVALLLTTFVFQSYEVDGPSMETTLQNQDRLLVWKLPRTIAKITRGDYLPKRYDVVIFTKHDIYEYETGGDKQLIKRVIGVPGDRVVVRDGKVTIYNKDNPDGFNPDIGQDFSDNIASFTSGKVDLVVQEGEIFVCGDNRTNSLDSRTFGTVQLDDVVGRLVMRVFPLNKFKSFI